MMAGDSRPRLFSPFTAFTLVVASMVGTGVLTSLGFQVAVLQHGFSILALWGLGGVASLCGAMAYAELGSRFPGSGGEYRYLSRLYHPVLGFVAGWASFLIGFAAPVAASGLALGNYLVHSLNLPESLPGFPLSAPVVIGLTTATLLTLVHARSHTVSGHFQNGFTLLKISVIVALILIGLFAPKTSIDFLPHAQSLQELLSPGFVISLYFVSYAYSGWNASAYIAGEIHNPEKNLPRSLLSGTVLVTLLYLSLNAVFLWVVPVTELSGQLETGLIFARRVLGAEWGRWMGLVIALLLVSGMSSMIIAGSRVGRAVASDYPALVWMSRVNSWSIPVHALWVQWILVALYLLTASFEQVILYIGFTLNLFAFLCVLGLVILRLRQGPPEMGYRTPGFPWVPGVFLLFSAWLLVYGLVYQPMESISGISVCLAGALIWKFALKPL